MNAKKEAMKIIGKYIYIDDEEPLVGAVAAALEARDKTIQRLLELDKVSAKAHNENLMEMAEMRSTIAKLEAEIERLKAELEKRCMDYTDCNWKGCAIFYEMEARIARLEAKNENSFVRDARVPSRT